MRTGMIYAFVDENKKVFYIGITTNKYDRVRAHKYELTTSNNLPKYNKMRKVLKSNPHLTFEDCFSIIEDGIEIENLFDKEIYYIKKYRKQGNKIYNLTDGGQGHLNPSDELREVFRQNRTGYKLPIETRKKISESKKGIKFSDEHKKNLSKARRKRKTTDETRKKMSESSKGNINIKIYEVMDPSGQKHLTSHGLTLFCEQHGLSNKNLHKTLSGERKHHKGWKILRKIENE